MAQLLKQSTAITIMFGPFVAVADGSSLLTDATTITDIDHATTGIFLSKAGAAAAIRSQAVTASVADAYGMMKVTLSTTDTGSLGMLDVLFAKASRYLPVHKSFMVVPANVFDSVVAGTDLLDVSVTQIGGVAQSATDLKDFADTGYDPATHKVQGVVLTDTTTALTAPTAAMIAAAVWDLDATGHTTQGTFGQAIGDPIADTNSIFKAVVTDATAATVGLDVVDLKTQIGTAGAGLTAADDAVLAAIPSAATVAAAVWDLDATTHQTTGTFGQAIGDPAADTHTIYDAVVTAAAGVNVAADIIAVKAETASIQTDTNDIQTRLPAALTANGNMKSSLVEILTTALTETAGQIAAGFKQFFNIGSPTSTMNLITTVTTTTTATNLTNLPSIPAGWITAAGIATGAVDADAIADDAAVEIANKVWDTDATTHQTGGTFGQAIGDPAADAHTIYDAVVTAAAGVNVAADIIAVKSDTAAILTAVDTEIGTLQTAVNDLPTNAELATALGTADDAVIAAIGALNDLSAGDVADAVWDAVSADHLDAGSTGLALASASAPTAAAVADAVWDGLMADHLDVGSTGAALNAAGAAGDPWITPIPGIYIAGQAGYVVGTTLVDELAKVPKSDGSLTLNVTASSDIKSGLSTQAELNKVPKSDGTTTWNATALGSIQTEANNAIVANRLDELLIADSDVDGAAPPTVGSVFHELMTKTAGSFTYDQATDSLEAIGDRGDAQWATATGFSTFDPTTDPVTLADGAHGGVNATIAAKSISVVNSANNGVAVNIQGTGTGNSHGINLSSANGKALAIGAVGNAVTIDSSAANGLVVNGALGDIVGDITGTLARVTLCDTTTTNTDMRGTNSAALAVNLNNGTITLHTDYDAAKSAASQTSVNDIPTNAELATALGTADDAVLIAIADLPTNAELATALGTADDAVLVQVGLIKAVTDQLAVSVKTIVEGTCAAGGNVTTIIASTLSPTSAVNDQFNGRIVIFTEDTTTTALRGQATAITGYDHATLTITCTALTTAPAAGDVFAIL